MEMRVEPAACFHSRSVAKNTIHVRQMAWDWKENGAQQLETSLGITNGGYVLTRWVNQGLFPLNYFIEKEMPLIIKR